MDPEVASPTALPTALPTLPMALPTQRKRTCSVNLLLRTLFHSATLALSVFVSLWGIVMCLNIDLSQHTDLIIRDLKYLAPGFGTNWNYIIIVSRHDATRNTVLSRLPDKGGDKERVVCP
ncbi:hypothetical protein RR46_12745 [Papilio xuthus]|uniref:Uncharacterized protein n=1 Tax=Papilio xuthus TaxID=66420 RepID=A0A194PZW8_PAPXU|nr:hypothetical protein RR46_12745 [Papilio xuthus]